MIVSHLWGYGHCPVTQLFLALISTLKLNNEIGLSKGISCMVVHMFQHLLCATNNDMPIIKLLQEDSLIKRMCPVFKLLFSCNLE